MGPSGANQLLNDVLKKAAEEQKMLPREIMAHRVSAEFHRHQNMVLGGLATVLTTLIGTAVFTGLVSQFGLNGKSQGSVNPFAVTGGIWLYGFVLFLSVLAPVVAALHSFMHNAEDAASHQASVAGYTRVECRLTIFLAKYCPETPPEKTDEALNAYESIMKERGSVLEKSLTLTTRAYEKADQLMADDRAHPTA
jgi:uncharacterized membrane protein